MSDEAPLTPPVPLMTWNIPSLVSGEFVQLVANVGDVSTIVGANGAGKSALAGWLLAQAAGVRVKRLIAHRKLWFQSAGPDLSPAQRNATSQNIDVWDRSPDSRYLDHADGSRPSIALFDLVAAINDQNRSMVDRFMADETKVQVQEAEGERVLERLNDVLRGAGLSIQIELTRTQMYDARNTQGAVYPAFQMSDGEKSALLLAAEVLTTPPGTVLIIDEPERHLHRAISANLIESIMMERQDCHFIVLTHDLELAAALDRRKGQTLVLTGAAWNGPMVAGWELMPLTGSTQVPDSARKAILGGRKNLLLIEGDAGSKDLSLYRILYPRWTLSPVGSCNQVISGVSGLRTSSEFHWVQAIGLVDRDYRDDEDVAYLRTRGVVVSPVSEVENFYYTAAVTQAVAKKQAHALDKSLSDLVSAATNQALSVLRDAQVLDGVASRLALTALRRSLSDQIPTTLDAGAASVTISADSTLDEVHSKLAGLLEAGDLENLLLLVPLRDTAVRARVSRALGFQTISDYERAAYVCIRDSEALADGLRSLIALCV